MFHSAFFAEFDAIGDKLKVLMQTHRIKCLSVFLILLVSDQATKHWALMAFNPGETLYILPILNLTLTFNEGIGLSMFSFLSDVMASYSQLLFGCISIAISIVIIWLLRREQRLWPMIGWSLVLSGAIGNAIDRFVAIVTWRTGVVDFAHVHWFNQYHFPVFNIADCAITFGFAIVLVDTFLVPKAASRQEKL